MAEAQASGGASTGQLSQADKFWHYLQAETTKLRDQITRLPSIGAAGGERADAVDHCRDGINRLRNHVNDASSYLPVYQQRTYGDAIKALDTEMADMRTTLAPRTKFAFKSGSVFTKKNESAISLIDAAELAKQRRNAAAHGDSPEARKNGSNTSSYINSPARGTTPPTTSNDGPVRDDSSKKTTDSAAASIPSKDRAPGTSVGIAFTHLDTTHILLPPSPASTISTIPATLSHLRRCIIDLSPLPRQPLSPSTAPNPDTATIHPSRAPQTCPSLTIRHVSSSLLLCGRVAGPAHVFSAADSVLCLATGQFRMHDSRDCVVYLSARSRPIIENCQGIVFAPLPDAYRGWTDREAGDETAVGDDRSEAGLFDQVDDFNWLRGDQKSPNWSVLQPGKRLDASVWTEIVPGGPKHGVDEILAVVGVKTG